MGFLRVVEFVLAVYGAYALVGKVLGVQVEDALLKSAGDKIIGWFRK
jgi:hypothetical protein